MTEALPCDDAPASCSPSAIHSGYSHGQHRAAHTEKAPPGSVASAPSCCECPEVEKHSASHRYETNDF